MSKSSTRLVLFILFTLLPITARAEPYIAVREGMKCSQCHTNKTGGGKRNAFGTLYSQTSLPTFQFPHQEKVPAQEPAGQVSERVSLGSNLRLANNTTFASPATNDFTLNRANLYLEVGLIKDYLNFYVDETMAPNVGNREIVGLITGLPGNAYIKGGRFFVPYGLRLLDDRAFTRLTTTTGFNMATSDVGIELGIEPGPLSWITSLTEGDPLNRAKQVATVAQFVRRHYRLGQSFAFNNGSATNQYSYGAFTGGTFSLFTLLGEFDFVRRTGTGAGDQILFLVELDTLLHKGLNLKLNYQWLNPDVSALSDLRFRIASGLEWFPTPFLQTSLFYRVNESQIAGSIDDANELLYELHLYF